MGVYPGQTGYGDPTSQAEASLEILELYKWWTEEYPNRKDPYDLSGWSDYCDSRTGIFDPSTDTPEDRIRSKDILDVSREIEDKYNQEDEDMMIRLIRIRESLWT